jgi:hypothetical protein
MEQQSKHLYSGRSSARESMLAYQKQKFTTRRSIRRMGTGGIYAQPSAG